MDKDIKTIPENPELRERALKDITKELAELKFALDESAIVAITDPKGRIIFANNTFCKISQYSREELIGQDHRIINSGYHSKEFMRHLWQTIQSGKVWRGEIRNKAKDGSFYWVDTTIVPFFDGQNVPYQYISIRHNITALKKREDDYKNLFESMTEGFALCEIICDPSGQASDFRFLSVNPAFEKQTGLKASEIIGRRYLEIFPNGESYWIERYGHVALTGEPNFFERYFFPLKRWFQVSVFQADSGQFGIIFWDITERKRAEEQIMALPAKIIDAQEEERKFISQEIHDNFGQLLIALKIFLANKSRSLVAKNSKLKQLTRALDVRIDEIIENARNLSHKLAPPNFKYIGLKRAVSELIESVNLEKNLLIKYSHRKLNHVNLGAKDIVIYRIIQEALSNIVKHSKARNAEISLRYKLGKLYVTIKDDGKGFDSKIRLQSSKSLGLVLMRERTRLVGGTLKIKSAHKQGTQIRVIIPVEEKANA